MAELRPELEYRDHAGSTLWRGLPVRAPARWRTEDDPCTDERGWTLQLGDTWAPPGEHNVYAWCGADWGWAHSKPIVLRENEPRVWEVSVSGGDYGAIRASITDAEREMALARVAAEPALDPNRGHRANLRLRDDKTTVCPACGAESMDEDLLAGVDCVAT